MERGWSQDRKAFVQSLDSDVLDAANLLMPLVFFMSPTDPRMLSTIDAVYTDLTSDSLVYRYDVGAAADDGLGGQPEGSFSMCTFWLVEALTRAGRLDEARFIFERMLGYSNHLGLYAEEIGASGEALGNFPQAFTHLSLISAAFNLDKALGAVKRKPSWRQSTDTSPGQRRGRSRPPCVSAGELCPSERKGIRSNPRLLRPPVGLRAPLLSTRTGRRPHHRDAHPRLLPAGAGLVCRAYDDEAEPCHREEP